MAAYPRPWSPRQGPGRPLRPKGGGRALPRLSPGSGSGAPRALELGDGRGEGIEREGYVLVRVGKRDIVLALAFEDAALAQEGVAAPHEGFLAQSGAVVLHLAVGEDDIEHGRLTDHAGLDAGAGTN